MPKKSVVDSDCLMTSEDCVLLRQTERTEKRETIVDFEELVDQQKESEMPTHVLWITIE